jgi:hypothetical protein
VQPNVDEEVGAEGHAEEREDDKFLGHFDFEFEIPEEGRVHGEAIIAEEHIADVTFHLEMPIPSPEASE